MRFSNAIFAFLVLTSAIFAASTTPFIGVVLEAETDIPVSRTTITYASGKEIDKTDAQGRFQLELESKNAKLVFIKDGYDTLTVDIGEFADPMDAIVLMVPNVRNLGQSTIIGGEEPVKFEAKREIEMESLEDAAGMRFDLTEHLSQMPGISGQKDFSSALYYDGSRASDVAYHLGKLRIPNMRHLDLGFPGNFSVVNPHVLSGLEFHDQYGEGPLGQGLATSVQYLPEEENKELSGHIAAATTMFEGDITMPFFIWDALRVNVRWLNSGMLENMGDKFFSDFNSDDTDCSDCRVKNNDLYSISAYDGYIQLFGSDSTGDSWALRAIYSNDEYAIKQDVAASVKEEDNITLFDGEQEYILTSIEYNAPLGISWHAGFVRENIKETLRDTTRFLYNENMDSNIKDYDNSLIDSYDKSHTTLSLGLDKNFTGSILAAKLSMGGLIDYHIVEHKTGTNTMTSTDLTTPVLTWISRLNWNEDKYSAALAVGAVADMDGNGAPMASFDAERKINEPVRVFGNIAYRSDWDYSVEGGKAHGLVKSGTSAKLGAGYRTKYLDVSAHGFGRYYYEPEMPTPKAFATYRELTEADYAWVGGASATAEWKTSHHFSMGTNIGSVYGEYELSDSDKSIPWESNARLDMVSHFRYYPRKDSMLSFILSHHAAWHRPLYYYKVTQPQPGSSYGTREIHGYNEYTDLFRTDLRVNLDFTRKIYFVDKIRFFVEVDNVLANLDVDALKFLGASNDRERSQVTQNVSRDCTTFDLVPFMAKGMGLYVQFGVDITF